MLIIKNAKLNTNDYLSSILIENEMIKKIDNKNNLSSKYNNIKTIDARGKTVLPGLNDSHLHIIQYAKQKQFLDLSKVKSIAEVVELGKSSINKNTEFIVGYNFNDNNLAEKRLFTKYDLDKISTDIPIVFYRTCLHICVINSKAIEVLNINKDTFIEGGNVDILNGEVLGILRENATSLASRFRSKELSVAEYKDLIISGIKDANKVGLTSLQSNDMSSNLAEAKKIYKAYIELDEEKKLNARINQQFTFETKESLDIVLNLFKYKSNSFKMGPLKLFIDGSLGGNTAALFENYKKDNQNGILVLTDDEFDFLLSYAKTNNLQVIVHAIGDRGIKIVIDGFNKYWQDNKNRNGIVHVQITSKELLEEFNQSKICALVQPIFINTDMFMVYDKVSETLANSSYAFNTLTNYTNTSLGSDAPVEDFNPFYGIYCAVTRKDLLGTREYIKEEALSLVNAIKGYTTSGAYMSFEENIKGEIKEGFLADLIIIDKDIYTIPLEDIKNINVITTIVGGRVVYEK